MTSTEQSPVSVNLPPPPPNPVVVPPTYIPVAEAIVRNLLVAGGVAEAASANNLAVQIVSGAAALISAGWAIYAWYTSHQKAVYMANTLPNAYAINKGSN